MTDDTLDLTPLRNALARLEEGWERHQKDTSDTQIRDSLLLHGWPQWRVYREMRAKTSHTDDEDVARDVVAGIPDFLKEAAFLLQKLESAKA
ncbi:MAG: hypothetical protein ACK4JC_03140 [Silanimonas lenta]